MEKICSKCLIQKPLIDYSKRTSSSDGYNTQCKACRSMSYFATRDRRLEMNKKWIQAHREYRREKNRQQYRHREKLNRQTTRYKEIRRLRRLKYISNPTYRITNSIRQRIYRSLKGHKNGQKWEILVGYTKSQLMQHIESQFLPDMEWDNYGEWHIDHKRPISSFNITSTSCDDFRKCWELSNLQPLWRSDNLKKGNRISL